MLQSLPTSPQQNSVDGEKEGHFSSQPKQAVALLLPQSKVDKLQEKRIHDQIIAHTLNALEARGISFSGVLYSNIMLTERGPMVLEHNTRFGDPETQALMMLLQADLLDVLASAGNPALQLDTLWREGYAVSLTLASGGYPGKYRTGLSITEIEEASCTEESLHERLKTVEHRLIVEAVRMCKSKI